MVSLVFLLVTLFLFFDLFAWLFDPALCLTIWIVCMDSCFALHAVLTLACVFFTTPEDSDLDLWDCFIKVQQLCTWVFGLFHYSR